MSSACAWSSGAHEPVDSEPLYSNTSPSPSTLEWSESHTMLISSILGWVPNILVMTLTVWLLSGNPLAPLAV